MAPEQLTFYDIASGPPRRTYAPNPWKSRLALNFKGASYTTAWVELPDVTETRKRLGVAASRKFPDGTDFFTLPVLHDGGSGRFVGDTFDIALYLDRQYPDGPRLMAPGTAGVTKAWNDRVDELFSRFAKLFAHGMPLNPDNAAACHDIFVDRWRHFQPGETITWEDCGVDGDERRAMLAQFEQALGQLEPYYAYPAGEAGGPFLAGAQPAYADMIVAGWLGCFSESLPAEEWGEMKKWHGGRWGNIWEALVEAKYTDCSK